MSARRHATADLAAAVTTIRASNDPEPDAVDRPALFEPFGWMPAVPVDASLRSQLSQHLARSRDVACGVGDVLAVLERDRLTTENCEVAGGASVPTLLSAHTAGNLMRLSIVSLQLLVAEADRLMVAVDGDAADRGRAV